MICIIMYSVEGNVVFSVCNVVCSCLFSDVEDGSVESRWLRCLCGSVVLIVLVLSMCLLVLLGSCVLSGSGNLCIIICCVGSLLKWVGVIVSWMFIILLELFV